MLNGYSAEVSLERCLLGIRVPLLSGHLYGGQLSGNQHIRSSFTGSVLCFRNWYGIFYFTGKFYISIVVVNIFKKKMKQLC